MVHPRRCDCTADVGGVLKIAIVSHAVDAARGASLAARRVRLSGEIQGSAKPLARADKRPTTGLACRRFTSVIQKGGHGAKIRLCPPFDAIVSSPAGTRWLQAVSRHLPARWWRPVCNSPKDILILPASSPRTSRPE